MQPLNKTQKRLVVLVGTALFFVLASAYFLWPMLLKQVYGEPILRIGSSNRFSGNYKLLCGNGTMFEEKIDNFNYVGHKGGTTFLYIGRLSQSDMSDLKSKLGTSFNSVDFSTAPPISGNMTDMDNTNWEVNYQSEGTSGRTITYLQAAAYSDLITAFEKRATPAKSGKPDQSGVTTPTVHSIDCAPR